MRNRLVPVVLTVAMYGVWPVATKSQSPTAEVEAALDAGTPEQMTAAGFPGEVLVCDEVTCPAQVSSVVGSYGPTRVSTAGATLNYRTLPLGAFQAGTSLRIGTCGMAETTFSRDNLLRLFIAGSTIEVAANDDSCGRSGSQINYVVPFDMRLELHAGCSGQSIGCAGTIALVARLDATPRLAAVKPAFRRARNQGVLGISPDTFQLIRAINYQSAGLGDKYHHQGIARTYLRSTYDLAWTTSVREDGGPEFNNVFFTRLGTARSTLLERFGRNVELVIDGKAYGSTLDAVIFGSNAGVYDEYDPGMAGDWDGVPYGRRFDHGGGIQAIGRYVVTTSEFVDVGDNIPDSGQASQVVLYDIAVPAPQPRLLIARKGQGSGWAAITKLGAAHAPPLLRNGYLIMVPSGNRLSLYAIPADPCTGYVSLAQVRPYRAVGSRPGPALDPLSPPVCPGVRTLPQQALADVAQVAYVGCVKRVLQWSNPLNDPSCPNLVARYADGGYLDFPNQDDVQSAHFVTQADGRLYLVAFVGYLFDTGPNSEVQLWRVVFGAASGADETQRLLPDGSECQPFVCLVRAGTEDARDSFKNMYVTGISGRMFRYGGGGYLVPSANPGLETFFFYGTEHYLQKEPRAALFNEF